MFIFLARFANSYHLITQTLKQFFNYGVSMVYMSNSKSEAHLILELVTELRKKLNSIKSPTLKIEQNPFSTILKRFYFG
jgi:hypothetical protein